MNCWHCGTELIWGGDSDLDAFSDEYDMITNLSCPNCGAAVEVYRPNYDHEDMKEYKKNLESDGVVLNEPSRSPDAPWIDDALDKVDIDEIIHNRPRESKFNDD